MFILRSEFFKHRTGNLAGYVLIGKIINKLIEFEEVFDGIWACASVLHVPSGKLSAIIGKHAKALKPGGIVFASFKYGEFEGMRRDRYFRDLTEDKAEKLLTNTEHNVENMWMSFG